MRSNRGWVVFFCVLGGLCLLGMLACLVEPVDPPEEPVVPVRAAGPCSLAPATQASAAEAEPLRANPRLDEARALRAERAATLPSLPRMRDANGHVLRTTRYLDSAYQSFRQEAACG